MINWEIRRGTHGFRKRKDPMMAYLLEKEYVFVYLTNIDTLIDPLRYVLKLD